MGKAEPHVAVYEVVGLMILMRLCMPSSLLGVLMRSRYKDE